MIKTVSTLLLAAAMLSTIPLTASCTTESGESENLGQVKMNLTGTSVEGNIYRLRAATFTIDGPSPTVLGTEADPDLTVLSADLPAGDYTSTLGGSWYLERNDGGAFVPVNATLVSENPVAFSVLPQVATDIVYQFATDGTIVTIGDGSVNISIDVIETGVGGSCTVFNDSTCPAGQTCTPIDLNTLDGVCIPPGPGLAGDLCASSVECAPNHACGDLGTGVTECIELCDINDPAAACLSGICQPTGLPLYGICQ